MKAKNISGRLARFLAVLMAMVLIVSCMAIPVALAENANTGIPEFNVNIEGLEKEVYKGIKEKLKEAYPDSVELHSILYSNMELQEGQKLIYVVVEDAGDTLYRVQTFPKVLFFLDAGYPFLGEGVVSEEVLAEAWASFLVTCLANGTDVYVYTSNAETPNAQVTKAVESILQTAFLEENSLNIVLEELVEEPAEEVESSEEPTEETVEELTEKPVEKIYVVKGAEESDTYIGTLHILQTDDLSQEEVLDLIFQGICNYIDNQ